MNIYCLIWSGPGLSQELANHLFLEAQMLFKMKEKSRYTKNAHCEGSVKTEWARGSLGSTFGYIFEADIVWRDVPMTAKFICRETDLEPEDLRYSSGGHTPYGGWSNN